jgi:hypothetical protein
MTTTEKTGKAGFDLYVVLIKSNCHRTGTHGYSRIIPVKEGNPPPRVGDVIGRAPCRIMSPDQSCDDLCGYIEIESITEVTHLDDHKILSLGLEQQVKAALLDT